jgi:hypothetical protein
MFSGKPWRQALVEAGVNDKLGGSGLRLAGARAGAIEPTDEPAPAVFDTGVMPFAAPIPAPWWKRPRVWAGIGVTAMAVGGLVYFARRGRRTV